MFPLEITLPDPLREFVEAQVSAGRAPTISDFVRQLVRDAQQKQSRQALEGALLQGRHSGAAAPMNDADWEQMRRKLWLGQVGCVA